MVVRSALGGFHFYMRAVVCSVVMLVALGFLWSFRGAESFVDSSSVRRSFAEVSLRSEDDAAFKKLAERLAKLENWKAEHIREAERRAVQLEDIPKAKSSSKAGAKELAKLVEKDLKTWTKEKISKSLNSSGLGIGLEKWKAERIGKEQAQEARIDSLAETLRSLEKDRTPRSTATSNQGAASAENVSRKANDPSDCDIFFRLDIKWVIPTVPNDPVRPLEPISCDQVCNTQQWQCHAPGIKLLTQKSSVMKAVSAAGHKCKSFRTVEEDEIVDGAHWDGPWINEDGTCGYASGSFFTPDCGVSTIAGHARICSCITDEDWHPGLCQTAIPTTMTTTFYDYDTRLGALQEYYDEIVPKMSTEWLAVQHKKYAGRLLEYKERLHSWTSEEDAQVQFEEPRWIVGQTCSGALIPKNCAQTCASIGGTCWAEPMKALISTQEVAKAVSAAGLKCSAFHKFQVDQGDWDGPWISSGGSCGYAHNGANTGWVPNCDAEPPQDDWIARICACKGATAPLPSGKCKEARTWWHQQWQHGNCDAVKEPLPGPISRHYHFVELGSRGVFVNREDPMSLISPDRPEYKDLTQEERLLLDNMRHTLAMNNATSVHFHDELSCMILLEKVDPRLPRVFGDELELRFKSDICRSAALYLEGGIYNDDDQINYRPIFPWLKESTHFAGVQTDHDLKLFANSFVAATPCHPLLRSHLQLILSAKTPGHPDVDEEHDFPKDFKPAEETDPEKVDAFVVQVGMLGPRTLAESYRRMYGFTQGKAVSSLENGIQFLRETDIRTAEPPYAELRKFEKQRHGHDCEFGFYDPEDNFAIHACSRC